MAQNVVIGGATFSDVPRVDIPRSGGGTSSFVDTSGDTVTADNLLFGATAHGADGNLITGSAVIPYNANLLDNADWYAYVINQRGNASYSGLSDAYGVDRWRTTGTISITAPTASAVGYITMSSGCVMKQRIEILPPTLIRKTITAAVDIGGTVHSDTVTFPASGEETVFSDGGVTVTVGLDSGTYEICGVTSATVPYIKITASAAVNVRRVWLELGNVCHMETTPPKSYAKNLTACQRYLQKLKNTAIYAGASQASPNVLLAIPTPTSMRIQPSISPSTNIAVSLYTSTGAYSNRVANLSVSGFGEHFTRISATITDGLTFTSYIIFNVQIMTDGILLSAEL